jgi:hypothetical protein
MMMKAAAASGEKIIRLLQNLLTQKMAINIKATALNSTIHDIKTFYKGKILERDERNDEHRAQFWVAMEAMLLSVS